MSSWIFDLLCVAGLETALLGGFAQHLPGIEVLELKALADIVAHATLDAVIQALGYGLDYAVGLIIRIDMAECGCV